MRALLLPVGQDGYAVEMGVAREVISAPALTPLPTAPPSVLGVCNLRGEIVPVFDLGRLLGVGAGEKAPYVAVVDTALGLAGLATSGVGEAVELDEPVAAAETPGTLATYALGARLVVLVDVEALLAPTRLER